MPKEIVKYPVRDHFSGIELSVHWSKEAAAYDGSHGVQIGLTRHVFGEVDPEALASPVHADHHHCGECAAVAEANEQKRQQRDADGFSGAFVSRVGSAAPPVGEYDPPATVFTDMSRSDINRLIRLLRRARDQAYGEDA